MLKNGFGADKAVVGLLEISLLITGDALLFIILMHCNDSRNIITYCPSGARCSLAMSGERRPDSQGRPWHSPDTTCGLADIATVLEISTGLGCRVSDVGWCR